MMEYNTKEYAYVKNSNFILKTCKLDRYYKVIYQKTGGRNINTISSEIDMIEYINQEIQNYQACSFKLPHII